MLYMSASGLPRSRRRSARLSVSTALAVVCLSAMAHQPAVAGDNKAYPGSGCQAVDGVPDIEHFGIAGVWNTSSTTARQVICPVVRDNTINTNGLAGDVWIYVNRSNVTGYQLVCTLFSTRASDGVTLFQFSRSTSATGPVRLSIPVSSSEAGGPYSIMCTVPPESIIYSYLVPEF
jgi:hypothetical protein